jgi:hypothetical protein
MWCTRNATRRARILTWRRLLVPLTLAVGAPAIHAEEFDAPVPPQGIDVERGVVVIRCVADQPRHYWRSRGAVLDVGAASRRRDVVLTARHGLPSTPESIRRGCSVRGEQQAWYGIEQVWLGPRTAEREHDWAVLVTARPLGMSVRRLAYNDLAPQVWTRLMQDQKPARLLLLRIETEQDGCRLAQNWLSAAEAAAGLFMHSCHSWDGLSGSPLIIGMNGEPVVIGIQLGRARRPLHGDGPPVLGIGRTIDATIAAAIDEAARVSTARR